MERAEVYQVWEKRSDQDRYSDDRPENYERVYASAADAQAVADEANNRWIERRLAEVNRGSVDNERKHDAACKANRVLVDAGLDPIVPVPTLRRFKSRDDVIAELSEQDGWLYVETVELVPASKPAVEVCHFCVKVIVNDGTEGDSRWVSPGSDDICDDGHSLHVPHSEWPDDTRTLDELRADHTRGLP